MAKEVKYRITAENQTAKGLKGAEKSLSRFKRASGAITDSLRRMFVVTFGDIVRVVRGSIQFISNAIRSFGEQQQLETDLAASFERIGASAADNVPRIQRLARAIQLLTTHGDEATLSAASYGLNLGVQADQIESVTVAAVGLAKILKRDLNTAMMLLARASQGSFDLFTRYGIQLDDTMTDQEKFNHLLGIGAQGFALARAEGDTLLGDIEQLRGAWHDFGQAVGGAALETVTATGSIDDATVSLLTMGDAVARAGRFWEILGKAMRVGAAAAFPLVAGAEAVRRGINRLTGGKLAIGGSEDAEADAADVIAGVSAGAGGGGGSAAATKPTRPTSRAMLGLSQAFDIARGVDRGPNSSPEVRAILDVKTAIERQTEMQEGRL